MKTVLLPLRTLRLCVSKAPLLTKEGWQFRRFLSGLTGWFFLIALFSTRAFTQSVPSPKDTLGFTPGDDRKLASWAQVVDYFKKLDAASDRMMFQEIGKTTMGAPFVYATISSPANLKTIEKYKQINTKLADPRTIQKIRLRNGREMASDLTAQILIRQGKTIVLITHGIHSTEVGSTLSSMLIAHRLASSNEPEIKKILDNTIILLVPSLNPDGVDIVNNWYQKTLGTPYEGTEPPELYHKYVGHDNNRDWYAFTQVETQLTVDKIHNVWHPQIVHDIHQQGQNGSRLFLPPYMQPVEPNVPKQIVEGYTELGTYMAGEMRKKGFQGITTNSTYDAWTPARAYSHYHGGVRILSETASCKLATPITVNFENLRVPADDGYDPKVESPDFGPVWPGGTWKLRNITDTMTTAAFALLNHAADNREAWLKRFYEIGKEAVRPRKNGELWGYQIANWEPTDITWVLLKADVEFELAAPAKLAEAATAQPPLIIPMTQPYGAFAKALLEAQTYPNLRDEHGNPITPYDVTSHTLPLLMNFGAEPLHKAKRLYGMPFKTFQSCGNIGDVAIFRSGPGAMDEGWTRWILEQRCLRFNTTSLTHKAVSNWELKAGQPSAIIFPDQPPAQILNGYAKGAMPDEYVGGVGKDGVENLKKFVAGGGTLVFLNRSSEFAIEQFNLPIRNVVKGLDRKAFYIPGSILRTELDTTHPIAKDMPQQSIAWFENGPVFEVTDTGGNASVNERATGADISGTLPDGRVSARVLASYPSDAKQILLSGWALGAEKIAGKAALVEVKMGKGKIILFGFRPQYRGQSLATFPLLFNAISN